MTPGLVGTIRTVTNVCIDHSSLLAVGATSQVNLRFTGTAVREHRSSLDWVVTSMVVTHRILIGSPNTPAKSLICLICSIYFVHMGVLSFLLIAIQLQLPSHSAHMHSLHTKHFSKIVEPINK